ncbi:MAG TPA: ATP-binding protein [Alphaproteobacteria bacterium]|nr:ATP-binding protein [Alphaproteobacteria bacterium]
MKTLRTPLYMLVAAATIPVLATAVVLAGLAVARQRDTFEARSRAEVAKVVEQVDSAFERSIAALEALAASKSLDSGDLQAFREEAQRVATTRPHWAQLVLVDGRTGANLTSIAANPAFLPRLIDANSLTDIARSPGPRIGDLASNPQLGSEPLIEIRIPILRNGTLRYVLWAGLRVEAITELLASGSWPRSWTATVNDRGGTVVARSRHHERWIGHAGNAELDNLVRKAGSAWLRASTLDGSPAYIAAEAAPVSGWSVQLAVPAREIDGPMGWGLGLIVAGIAGSLAIAVFLAWLVIREIRDRREREKMIQQSQRMELIGQMTSGVAHDFNNILGVLVGILETVARRVGTDAALTGLIASGIGAVERGRTLTQQLLAFARRQTLKPEIVHVNDALSELNRLIPRSLDHSVRILLDFRAHGAQCLIDRSQFDTAILNLLVNSRDAMPQGGTIRIRTEEAPDGLSGIIDGPAVLVSVVDNGQGISADIVDRVFDPFFTTKPPGKGTGLGLSQVYGFVKQSSGHVEIASRPGEGTTVRIWLPRAAGQDLMKPPPPQVAQREATEEEPWRPMLVEPPAARPGGERTVLVVDDEIIIATSTALALNEAGFATLIAADGHQAKQILAASEPHIDLLFTDLILPQGPNGLDLARFARERRPEIRIVIASGHITKATSRIGEIEDYVTISKPYSGDQAVAAMNLALLSAGSPSKPLEERNVGEAKSR